MPKICEICGKRPVAGRHLAHRGLSKKKGGTGVKTARVSKRFFLPNVQKIKIVINGGTKTCFVCTRCIKGGKVTKKI